MTYPIFFVIGMILAVTILLCIVIEIIKLFGGDIRDAEHERGEK